MTRADKRCILAAPENICILSAYCSMDPEGATLLTSVSSACNDHTAAVSVRRGKDEEPTHCETGQVWGGGKGLFRRHAAWFQLIRSGAGLPDIA